MSGINLNNSISTIHPPISAFQRAAKEGAVVQICIEGSDFDVQAQGHFNHEDGTFRSVSWVTSSAHDATHFFLSALKNSYGEKLSEITFRELKIQSKSDQSLESRVVIQALNMAKTSYEALGGVDFATKLEHSAQCGGPEYKKMLLKLKIEPDTISTDQKLEIDNYILNNFKHEAAEGRSPVSRETAMNWLRDKLILALKDAMGD
jgi:hypothetical protein